MADDSEHCTQKSFPNLNMEPDVLVRSKFGT